MSLRVHSPIVDLTPLLFLRILAHPRSPYATSADPCLKLLVSPFWRISDAHPLLPFKVGRLHNFHARALTVEAYLR